MDSKKGNITMDLEALWEELGLDREQFSQFASLFLDVAFTDLTRMKEALAGEDLAGVAEAAHSIKGAALTLELDWISSVAKSLETDARAGEMEKVMQEMDSLARELERLRSCFQEQGLLQEEGALQVEP